MYDFMTLAPDEFESLVADLFSKSWGARLERFKLGKDGGIDLRHSRVPAGQPTAIVQCKRYRPDKFTELMRSVREEAQKLVTLQPDRYVLATSVLLSAHQKQQLVDALAPWCRGPEDIYGGSELNGLLNEHPVVERAHFKLWLSSTVALERILHADVFALSEANIEAAREMLSRLVMHPGFAQALQVLEKRHHVLILGNPGIGKSTLARMLMSHFLHEDFEPAWTTTIRDAWKVAHAALDESRRVFIVLDDFLGRLRFAEKKLEHGDDRSLFALLDFAGRHSNVRLVLTTREYILEDAKQAYGLLDERAKELSTYTLRLSHYSHGHRARMVFNHLYFSDLPDSRLEALVASRTYRTIIGHVHFSPRVVENISKTANSHSMSDAEYLQYVSAEFDNPKDLWRHPFENEISPLAQRLLYVLWTFNGSCDLVQLRSAVSILQSETRAEDREVEFDRALRQLDGNFLVVKRDRARTGRAKFSVAFQNPSVEEFVEQRLATNGAMFRRLVSSVVSFEQVQTLVDRLCERRISAATDPNEWTAVREAAARFQDVPSGEQLGSMKAGGEYVGWLPDPLPLVKRMQVLLRIEKAISIDDARFQSLKGAMLSSGHWLSMIQGCESSDSIASAAKDLQKWVVKESGWSEEGIEQSATAFRAATIAFLSGDDAWAMSIGAIVDLLDGCVSGSEGWLTAEESKVVRDAALVCVGTILNNYEDQYEVLAEVQQLGSLAIFAGDEFHRETERLQDFADQLRDRDADRPPETTASSQAYPDAEPYVDVDELFQDLIGR